MKTVGMILLSCFFQTPDLKQVRALYLQAPVNKVAAKQLDLQMSSVDSNAVPVLCCYKGANEMIKAKYALNPFNKLDNFNRGKAWIDAAINRDTLSLEMRFIRFSVQSNLPSFLGYRDAIARDKIFLLAKTRDCSDTDVRKVITNYLSASGALTPGELKQLYN